MAGEKILLIDDDPEIRNLMSLFFTQNGFQVLIAGEGQEALELTKLSKPDLIILDVLLPGLDGLEVCQELRRVTTVPIIFVSCKGEEMDKILGLTAGGDDYITKPFSPGELVARVKAHLRRGRMAGSSSNGGDLALKYGGLEIDTLGRTVTVNGSAVYLLAQEFKLLLFLAQNPNRVFSVDELFRAVWNVDSLGDTRTVLVHISNLRKKIESDPSKPRFIQTVKGAGYKFYFEL